MIPAILLSVWYGVVISNNSAVSPAQRQFIFLKPFYEATSLQSQGKYEKAIQSLLKALFIARYRGQSNLEAKCLLRLGIFEWDLGKIELSSNYFDRALEKYRNYGDICAAQFCMKCIEIIRQYKLGKLNRSENSSLLSIQRFDEAIKLSREIGFSSFEIKCLRQKGLACWQINKLDVFLKCNVQGLELSNKIGHGIEKGRFLNNIGVYYQKNSDYSRALAFFESALTVLRAESDKISEAECLSNIGITYRDLGDLNKAQLYLSSALELDEKHGGIDSVAIDLDNLGSIYLRRGLDNQNTGDLLQALEVFKRCISLRGEDKGAPIIKVTAFNNVGIILSEMKEYEKARNIFNSAIRMLENSDNTVQRCEILNNIAASFYYEKNISVAINKYSEALKIGTRESLPTAIMESYLGLGKCYEILGMTSQALIFYYKSIEAKESIQDNISSEQYKIGFARNKIEAYQRAIEILTNSFGPMSTAVDIEEIFRLIERMKARAFIEGLIEARDNKDKQENYLQERSEGILQDISPIYKKITPGVSVHPYTAKLDTYLCNISQVQNKIVTKETALLEYFIGENNSYLIMILNNTARLFKLAGRHEIDKSVRPYIKMISSHSVNNNQSLEAAERIGKELIPIIQDLEYWKIKGLIIIPDGILHSLPFESLRFKNNQGSAYLIERMKISYCPSASSILALKYSKNSHIKQIDKLLLALGGANYKRKMIIGRNEGFPWRKQSVHSNYNQSSIFSSLPFSEIEVLEIARLFPINARDILVGRQANERALKNMRIDKYRIIHFACHAILDERYPLQSAIVLGWGGEQEDDGFLQMKEITGLNLNADLVVLSACQTGNGRLEKLEGLIGLARPFFYAGARSVLSSLWKINDKAAVFFMREFYRNLVKGLASDMALQRTKIKMLHSNWSHPFFWAGYILSGDSTTLSLAELLN